MIEQLKSTNMNTTNPILLHVYFDTLEEAKRESYITGCPYFRSYINGQEMYSVRLKIEPK